MHLNYFEPYQSKPSTHEDQLTRAYLLVLRYSPTALLMFYDYVHKTLSEAASEKKIKIEEIPSISSLTLAKASFKTQIKSLKDTVESGILVSVLVTDEGIKTSEDVAGTDRDACYDGVVTLGDISLVIENKPRSYNVWEKQLSPSKKDIAQGVNVVTVPAILEWKQIITGLNELTALGSLGGAESLIIDDFLQFIDRRFPYLNPYTSFSICKDDEDALRKRCVFVLEALYEGKVEHHRGWKDSARLEDPSIKEIALAPNMNGGDWEIILEMYPGNTMNQAREFYKRVDGKKLLALKKEGWEIAPHMCFSFMASQLVAARVALSLEAYLEYWKKESAALNKVKRDDFAKLFEQYEKSGLISKQDHEKLGSEFLNTKRQTLNICPGLKITYSWAKLKAIALDDKKAFITDVKNHIDSALDAWLNKQ